MKTEALEQPSFLPVQVVKGFCLKDLVRDKENSRLAVVAKRNP